MALGRFGVSVRSFIGVMLAFFLATILDHLFTLAFADGRSITICSIIHRRQREDLRLALSDRRGKERTNMMVALLEKRIGSIASGGRVALAESRRQVGMPRWIPAILIAAFCAGCSQTSTTGPVGLTPAMFDGYEFTLISDKDYMDYLFLGGEVSVTFGQKALVGLAQGWKIRDTNTLVFTAVSAMPAGSAFENPERGSLQFKSFGETLVVTMDGQKFRRSKFKRPD